MNTTANETTANEANEASAQTPQEQNDGITSPKNAKHNIQCLSIIGQVEGHYILPPENKTTKYEHIIPALVETEQNPEVEGLLIILNTVGGDVEAGLAIAELISGMSKPTVSLVVGGGHSIGVPLAVCARKIFIAPSATMTVHPVRLNGMMLGVPQTMDYFNRMQSRITDFVISNSHITKTEFSALMMNKDELVLDVGTVLNGTEAVRTGLIDNIGGLSDATAFLYALIEKDDAA